MNKNTPIPAFYRSSRIAAAAVLLLVASCDIFETREPEEPDDGSGPGFIQPRQPLDIFTNLQNAVVDMNPEIYRRLISEEEFVYYPADDVGGSEIWDNWGYASETDYFNNLASATEGLTGHELQLTNERDEGSGDRQTIIADYNLSVNHGSGDDEFPDEVSGEMQLEVSQDEGGYWIIVAWNDYNDDRTSSSWSRIREAF